MIDKKKNTIQKRVIQGAAIVIFVLLIMRVFDCGGAQWLDEGLGADGEFNAKYQTLRSLALVLAGLVGLLGWLASNQRANAMTDSVDAQVKDNENKTFHEAIKHLGDSSASVRLGGIYALYDLALFNPEKRLKNIIEILSSHVRETTQEKKYQEKYEKKPSNEISSLLKLLSNLNTKYLSENEEAESSPLDLSHACLCGVRLLEADFRKAFFIGSHFEGAMLYRSHFECANLEESHFEGAELEVSYFAGANLSESHFEGAELKVPCFTGANLEESHFAGAKLEVSHFEGANLEESHFEGAELEKPHFEGAALRESHFECANLEESHFEGAYDDQDEYIDNFMDRIEKRTEKKAEIGKTMIFAGRITEKYIKDLEKIIKNTLPHFFSLYKANSFQKRMEKAIDALKRHKGHKGHKGHKISEHLKGKFLGELTKEKADEIIQRYKKAMKTNDEIKEKHK